MVTMANWAKIKGVGGRAGVTRRVFSGSKSMMVMSEILPSAKPYLHDHPHEQLTYIVSGTCRLVIGDDTVDMVAGDVIMVPPGVPHSVEVTSKEPVLDLDVFTPPREDYL
jgi:quercetin dioxygenase-like cupin family protein